MGPLYKGLDLSTKGFRAIAFTSQLRVVYQTQFGLDADSIKFIVTGEPAGVLTNEAEHEDFTPVDMWLQALDSVLERLKEPGSRFSIVQGHGGASQQHGSVYWYQNAESLSALLES